MIEVYACKYSDVILLFKSNAEFILFNTDALMAFGLDYTSEELSLMEKDYILINEVRGNLEISTLDYDLIERNIKKYFPELFI